MKTALLFGATPNPAPSYFGPPYGIALLGAVLKRAGKEVICRDYDRDGVEAMLADLPVMLATEQPDLVGLSCLSVNRGATISLARELKRLAPDIPIILGGPFPSIEPELMLEQCPADLVCVGDGDETLLEVIDAMETGRPLTQIAGLAIRQPDGSVMRTPTRPRFTDLDSLPYPDLDLFGVTAHLADFRQTELSEQMSHIDIGGRKPFISDSFIMVMSSRGCSWNCSFCPLSMWEGKTLFHSPAYVVDQIAYYVERYGHRKFVFGDNTLSYPRRRIIEICDMIVARGLEIEWICMTRADMVDADVLAKMAAAGCREISYGIESLAPEVQKAMNKKLSVKRVAPTFELTHEAGISSVMMMMVGNEGETRETMRATLNRARDIQPDRILIWTTKVYPGTKLWDRAMRDGIIPDDYFDDDFAAAPDYTGENDATELRHLETMLQHRTTYVRPGDNMQRRVLSASWRGKNIVLGDADPATLGDIPKVIGMARDFDVRDLWLHTDAGWLGSVSVRRAVQAVADHVLAGFIVPLYGLTDTHHDHRAGRPGALLATRKAVLGWTRNNKAPVRAWAYLDRFNTSRAADWVRWMHAHGMGQVVFIFGSDPAGWDSIDTAELPTLSEAGAALRDAAAVASELGVSFEVCGLPECALSRGEETIRVESLGRPFDENMDDAGRISVLSQTRRAAKRFVDACEDCAVRLGCEGVLRDYIEQHGATEVRACPSRRVAPGSQLPILASGVGK